ncbi:MAG: HD domain-containing protein [Clostridium lundense]|nr:HD domain-containing protein [Clostridium lundense]
MKLVIVNEKLVDKVLGNPIYTENGMLFANKGNTISSAVIKRLKSMGITTIYIEDGNDEITLQEVLPTQVKLQILKSLKQIFKEAQEKEYINYEKTITIVRDIIQNINLSENASLISNLAYNDEVSKLALHSLDVTIVTLMVGIRKKFDNAKLIKLGNAALLHDIGKLLTDDTSNHTEIGYKLVKRNPEFAVTTYMSIYYLFEREDGSGPLGVKGEKLNEFVKIISICNEYIENISLDKGILPHEAVEKITAQAVTKFDKDIFKDFVESIYCYPNGLHVKLNNSLSGIVVMQNKGATTRPIVAVHENDSYRFCNLMDSSNLTLFIQEVLL